MGANIKGIFRPGLGAVIQAFTSAFSADAAYPADWMALNTVDPTSQGVSGVIDGKTLGSTDYVEAVWLDSDNVGAEGLALGVCMGKGIGAVSDWSDVNGDVVADGDLIVIQCWGVHPNGRQVTGAVLGDYLTASTITGECLNGSTDGPHDSGVALETGFTYGMATAGGSDEDGSVVFITCMG